MFARLKKKIIDRFRTLALFQRVVLVSLPLLLVCTAVFLASSVKHSHNSEHLAPAEHLARAKADCGDTDLPCADESAAAWELSKIPRSSPEHAEALVMLTAISKQGKQESDMAWEQAQRNFQGLAHDMFTCATSADHQLVVSYDSGSHWWADDGRCAALQEQQQRDEDAEISSYWATTLRVDTNMDSSWLPNEERTCRTTPDSKGRVAVVICGAASKATHNIPVTFWGGVDRNVASDRRCRREKGILSDNLVCRAIN